MAKSAAIARDDKREIQPATGIQVPGMFSRAASFLKDVRGEMRKVVTPSMEEVRNTTTVVIITVFAFAAFFYVVDGVLGKVVQGVLHWLGGAQ
jgi:preprotein translocase subunit SecE